MMIMMIQRVREGVEVERVLRNGVIVLIGSSGNCSWGLKRCGATGLFRRWRRPLLIFPTLQILFAPARGMLYTYHAQTLATSSTYTFDSQTHAISTM